MIDVAAARDLFEDSTDGTVGIEEEFALLDPQDHRLIPAFERLRDAGQADDVLADAIAGELISSEIEIRSGRGTDYEDARRRQHEARRRLFALAAREGVLLGATGTHPLSDYREQHIIDTPHYHRVEDGLKYVAWRNNTFSAARPRRHPRRRSRRPGVRPPAPRAAAAAGGLGQLALRRPDRLGPALRPHADLHQVVPALRRPGRVRHLGGVGGVRRPARAHQLDHRVHPAVVVGAAAPQTSGRSRCASATPRRPAPRPTGWRR